MAKHAPKDLGPEAKQFWLEVNRDYALRPDQEKLLEAAARCWDRIVNFRIDIAKNGTTFIDRYNQPKERPEVVAERQYYSLFMRLVRELGLSVDTSGTAPPTLY